jgi:DNA-directed RNA polymerase subunit alpha
MMEEKKLKIEVVEKSGDSRYGKFVCEPLDRGYGITLGNSLRRILLSSLDGAAITSIKIDGVLHEFSTIPGVREDVTDIILNLKQLCLKLHGEEDRQEIVVDVAREGEMTAKELDVNSDIEILNPELHIATLDSDAHLRMTLYIERGKGYMPSTKNKRDTDVIGVIPIDSIFSPILRAKYEVGNIRVGNEMDFDKLTLEVWTDGSVTAPAAVGKAATIMVNYLKHFQKLAAPEDIDGVKTLFADESEEDPGEEAPDLSKTKIDELELSVRASNCLKRANIYTLADLLEKTEDDLSKIRNLGKKSVDEIIEKLKTNEYELKKSED